MLLSPPNTLSSVFCFILAVAVSYKTIQKQKKVQKRKHLLTFFLCLIQFLSMPQIRDWTALVETGKHKLWIGLVLDPEHGWQWSDAKPFRYLRWSTGRTSSQCGSFTHFQGLFYCRDAQIFFLVCFTDHPGTFSHPITFIFNFCLLSKYFPLVIYLTHSESFSSNTIICA